tara:strand:- start:366 stop:584 length:219 start_codon:yes stop_codon:yes gene_type:complete
LEKETAFLSVREEFSDSSDLYEEPREYGQPPEKNDAPQERDLRQEIGLQKEQSFPKEIPRSRKNKVSSPKTF